jgi:hypothetical protein
LAGTLIVAGDGRPTSYFHARALARDTGAVLYRGAPGGRGCRDHEDEMVSDW